MPSDALLAWQTDRVPRLQNVEADCLHLEALHAAAPGRVQEYIRSYVVLLSAEFQGFCRDLHYECAAKLVLSVTPLALQNVLRSQCVFHLKLDTGNANPVNPAPLRGKLAPRARRRHAAGRAKSLRLRQAPAERPARRSAPPPAACGAVPTVAPVAAVAPDTPPPVRLQASVQCPLPAPWRTRSEPPVAGPWPSDRSPPAPAAPGD
jgi:hypothetical protein